MSERIYKLIRNGEGEGLDFKQSITDAAKIAKTIAAFANGEGGILLVGVKDNRRIAGVRSEDEKYMFDLAAKFFCRPQVDVTVKEWQVEGKTVLECKVDPGKEMPYYAKGEDGKWVVYLRRADQTLKAGLVAVEVMKRKSSGLPTMIQFQDQEKALFGYLAQYGEISLKEYRKVAGISHWHATRILVNLVSANLISYNLTEKREYYTLK